MMKGGVPRRHLHPLESGVMCDGAAVGPYFYGHRFLTDVLMLQIRFESPLTCPLLGNSSSSSEAARSALTSLVEALSLAASRVLQIEEGELSGNWSPVLNSNNQKAQIFLYDLLPGGAGYTKQIQERLPEVLEATEELLAGCVCEASCYNCLRHYANNFFHHQLNRRLALDLVRYIRHREIPVVEPARMAKALEPLKEILRLRDVECCSDKVIDGTSIPLTINMAKGGEILLDVHHPLIDPFAEPSSISKTANRKFKPFVSIDAFTLEHNLPKVFDELDGKRSG